ncbi:MAG: trimeric intracellular cation channel family protein [Veillonella sp.]
MDIIWYMFDMIGTIAFAVSGALVGVARKMDIFGMTVLALATAIGGGIVRDVLLGYFPPNSLRNVVYVTVVLVVTVIVFLIYNSRYRKHAMGPRSRASYLLADALGLASFTVTGASAGFKLYPELPIFIVLLGTITAVGGGIIRDMLAQRIPSVLKEDVYALPSIIGGIVYYLMVTSSWDEYGRIWCFHSGTRYPFVSHQVQLESA